MLIKIHQLFFVIFYLDSFTPQKLSRYWRFSGILTSPPWVNCVVTALLFGLHPEQLAEMIPVEMHEAHGLRGEIWSWQLCWTCMCQMTEVDLDREHKNWDVEISVKNIANFWKRKHIGLERLIDMSRQEYSQITSFRWQTKCLQVFWKLMWS